MMNNGNMMGNMNMMNNNMGMMNNNMMGNMNNNMGMMNNNMNIMNNMNKINMMNNMQMMNAMKVNQMNQIAQNNMTFKRLEKEFKLCSQDEQLKDIGCNFIMEKGNYYIWRVTMKGPNNTPYQGGIFTIRITFPLNYPKSGPEFRFLNKIYHLNVDFTDVNKFPQIYKILSS